jgi:protein-tyrosine phosphatase
MLDIELYGGNRGILQHLRARAMYALGAYGTVRGIEWPSVRRLVFVCLGNICRSPYASVRAQSRGVSATSFGLDAAEGAPADPAASRNALLRGIDLSEHRSQRLASTRLTAGDLIIVFEPAQLAEVRRRFGVRTPAKLLGIWSRPSRPHIQDPYGLSDRYFQRCFSVIDDNVAKLAEYMARSGAPAASREPTDIPRTAALHGSPGDRTHG